MFELVNYQEEAVQKLVDSFRELLRTKHNHKQIVFKSPTGSGKTIMAAELLKRLAEEELPGNYVYVWAAPNALHQQSYEKLSSYLSDSPFNFIDIGELTGDALPSNAVLFTNWEKVYNKTKEGKWKNRAVRDDESGQNVINVLDKTRESGTEVILIVDEAHNKYLGQNSQQFVEQVIRPKLVLEVSATPVLSSSIEDVKDKKADFVKVPFGDVIASGLIKEETVINKDIGDYVKDDLTKIDAIVQAALSKRVELENKYEAVGSDIKPLVLIQLPGEREKSSELDISVQQQVEEFLYKQDITYENRKLAVWLSEDKRNKENIEDNNSTVEVLIFKQAIALGWDCPRAQILVMLSDIKSETFKIQTVGRILRMPEAYHYNNPELNRAFVYTNIGHIMIDNSDTDSDGAGFIKNQNTVIKPNIENVMLPSIYLSRTDYHALESRFKTILNDELDNHFEVKNDDTVEIVLEKLKAKGIEIDADSLTSPIISDSTIENLDDIDQQNIKTIEISEDPIMVKSLFDNYVLKSWIAPYGFVRSFSIMKTALYSWFSKAGFDDARSSELQRLIVCSEQNQRVLKYVVDRAKDDFNESRYKDIREKREINETTFSIPSIEFFPDEYQEVTTEKYVMQQRFIPSNRVWATESKFEEYLDASDKVDWWYKNGEKMEQYFGIYYVKKDEETGIEAPATFYPDYIVRFLDGHVGIFDTKSGSTAENKHAKAKSDALQRYIADNSELNLFGGLIKVQGDSFEIQENSDYDNENQDKWKPLIF
ncbi:MAG: DEAD/DEAH box helicase family protein [Micrococcaceae bacterium]